MQRSRVGALAAGLAITCVAGSHAWAAQARPARKAPPTSAADQRLRRLEAALQAQAQQLSAQAVALDAQRQRLDAQEAQIGALRSERDTALALAQSPKGASAGSDGAFATAQARPPIPHTAPVTDPNVSQASGGGPPLVSTVGEAPPDQGKVEVAALPEESSVLTPRGGWYVEPSVEYTRSSANVLVFRGVEIVTGVQIGLLQANSAARDTIAPSLDARYGLTNRIELEARIPYVDRLDRIQTVAQRDQTVTQTQSLGDTDVGDLEFSARYQFNTPRPGLPIILGGLRYKADTGVGPFDVPYDEFGVAQGLATGSGFQAIEPSVSVLLPTDPAVIFANVSYIHNFGRNIDKEIGGAHVGKVEPGDLIGASTGFGFAVNPRFSFSLGYKHNYIFPTYSFLNDTKQRSNVLQVGAFTFGWSYALTGRITLASTFAFGVTSDAPGLDVIFRLPIQF